MAVEIVSRHGVDVGMFAEFVYRWQDGADVFGGWRDSPEQARFDYLLLRLDEIQSEIEELKVS